MQTVLITGGLGYIGSHTIVQLPNNYEPIIVDNLSNSSITTLASLEKLTQKNLKLCVLDMCDIQALETVFKNNKIDIVIHFAAYKSVSQSVENPLAYYKNNLESTINLLTLMKKYSVSKLIFSSSCSVYGNQSGVVTEETPFGKAQSPYANTKQICEQLIENSKIETIILRYFNPVGVHPSLLLGEDKSSISLVPALVRGNLKVFGHDYDTKDGTPLRDYVHVMDIADAHVCALERFKKTACKLEIYNLGSGKGSTVLEVIKSFEKVSGKKLDYTVVERRVGDVEKIYADTTLAISLLKWKPKYSLTEMILSYWKYYIHNLKE